MELRDEIKTELEYMYQWLDCESALGGASGIPYNYRDGLENGYKAVSERLNVSVEYVKQIDACTQLSSLQ